MRFRIACYVLILVLEVGNSAAETFQLDVLETEDLRLLYLDPTQTYLTPHLTRSFHNSLAFHKRIFDWVPYEKPTMLLLDPGDYANASAAVTPRNILLIDIAPLDRTLELFPASERFFMFMNHELAHLANLDASNEQDLGWRRFFGGKPMVANSHPESILYNYLTTPRSSTPRWYGEGAAVFMETWMSGGLGRGQGAYDEMVFRAMVRDDAHFYSNLGLVSEGTEVSFQAGANAYLYGTRFMSYLALNYSPEHVVEWLQRGQDSERYYSKHFEKVFGKKLEPAWNDWIAWEHEFQASNLEGLREFPLTPTTPLTQQGLGSVSKSFYDPDLNALIGGLRYPGVVGHVGVLSLEDGSIRRLVDIKDPSKYRVTSPAYDRASKTLFYTADNYNYRDLMAVNVVSGAAEMLIEDGRIGDLVFNENDKSLWGLRHLNGRVSLVHIPSPYTEWNMIHSWPQGTVPFELDMSPDGSLLSMTVGEVSGDQFLRIFRIADLMDGEAESVAEFNFGTAIPEGFVFSPDGKYLFGTSYYTGVSNVFRYELETGDIEAVSNAETGFFRPIPMGDGKLIVLEFTGQGFLPGIIEPVPIDSASSITFLGSEIAKKHPVVREWSVVNTLADQPYEDIITHEGKYSPRRELGFETAYPVIEGYRGSEAIGWYLKFADPMQLNNLELSASYSWDTDSDESLHVNAEYSSLHWNLRYWHNGADFYDIFGPKERSRKGDAFLIGYKRTLIYDDPRRLDLTFDVNYYTGLDTLPNNQNVGAFLFEDILHTDVSLIYNNVRESLGAVDHEKGWRWDLSLSADNSRGENFPKFRGGVDFGFALPWKHSSVWLYNSAGTAGGDRLNPLTSFYFGGFQNNYVDDREVKRYREYSTFPGFEIDEINAKDYYKTVLEWNLPPKRFREAGRPSLFLKHVRPAIFAGALITDPGERYERTLTNIGFQLDFEFTLVHRLPMVFSVGWAAGYEDGHKHDDEWMISLKIL